MDIRLSPEAEELINQYILEGFCHTPDEAVGKALDLLKYQVFLEKRVKSDSKKIEDFAGCLSDLNVLEGDSVKIQRAMRDEW